MIKFALNIKLRYMLRKVLSLLFFIGFLVNGNLIAQLNLLTNGSLTGIPNLASAPSSWKLIRGNSNYSSDINDINVSPQDPIQFVISPSNSNDGGSWSSFVGVRSLNFYEGIYQQVSLTANKTYTISYEFSHFGATSPIANNDDAFINVIYSTVGEPNLGPGGFSTNLIGKSDVISMGEGWKDQTLSFTPNVSTDYNIGFQIGLPSNSNRAYVNIDGIAIVEQNNTSGNNCPVANDDGNIVNEGELTVGNVFDNDSDADGDLLQIVAMIKLPDHGSLTSNSSTGEYVYQHYGEEEFSDIFTYVVTDGNCTDTADVVISITPKNDPPVVIQDTFYVNEGDTLTVLNSDPNLIINNDLDPDNTVSDFTAQLSIPTLFNATGTTFMLGSKGAFQYIHGCNNATMDVFQYYVSDLDQQSEFRIVL